MKLAILFLALVSCTPKHVSLGQPVSRDDYAYEKVGEYYWVYVKDGLALQKAQNEICGRNVCLVQHSGDYYTIQVTP